MITGLAKARIEQSSTHQEKASGITRRILRYPQRPPELTQTTAPPGPSCPPQ